MTNFKPGDKVQFQLSRRAQYEACKQLDWPAFDTAHTISKVRSYKQKGSKQTQTVQLENHIYEMGGEWFSRPQV